MAQDRPASLKPLQRLMIVDDDPLIRLVASERLAPEGFEVIAAPGGAEALESFEAQGASLILLDVEMPGMDGYDVCARIRRTSAGKHVPILILTGRNDIDSIERAYESGATDFMMKPINWLILSHRIRYMLRASESFLAVRSQQIRLHEVQQHARLGSWEVDVKTGLLTASTTFRTLLGLDDESEVFPLERALAVVHADDRAALKKGSAAALARRDGFSLEHRVVLPDGSERIVHSQARVRTDEHDECVAMEGFTQDITERRQTEEQVRILEFRDSLTGLANRAAFRLHLDNAIHRATRTRSMLGVLYLDVDQFKRVNDTFGHSAGDRLLCSVAEQLTTCIRETDVLHTSLDPDTMIARLGGDEFTIVLDSLSDPRDASRVAQRVLASLSRPAIVEGHEIRTTVSIGISIFPDDGDSVEALLRNADLAMYHAKGVGRSCFQYYRKELNSHALERLELEASLSRAIQHDDLFVHFQPKLDLRSGKITGCEALARWWDSRAGSVSPSAFVPLAESTGLISGLGESILRKACLGSRVWQQNHAGLKLAVNLSPGQIKDERLLDRIDSVLAETQYDPNELEFEITESALIHDEQRTLEVLEALRARGCQISLDDFGTGYSSLSNLKRFPVQTLKIDQSFVSGIGLRKEDEAITAAILSMAHGLGIRVVAEGIETEEQQQFLQDRGCDELQGFLISRPLSPKDFARFIDSYNR